MAMFLYRLFIFLSSFFHFNYRIRHELETDETRFTNTHTLSTSQPPYFKRASA